MTGIKETLDVLTLVEETAKAIKAARADGTIDWNDLDKLGPVVVDLRDAIQGSGAITEEMGDLDVGEQAILLQRLGTAISEIVGAIIG